MFVSPTADRAARVRFTHVGGMFAVVDGNVVSAYETDTGRPAGRKVSPNGGPQSVIAAPGTGLFAVAWANAVSVYRIGPDLGERGILAAKPQVPAKADADTAAAKVRDAYKADLAKKTPADRRKLAERLLKEADAAQPADRHAMLTLALATAAELPDPPLAMKAIDALDESFAIDAPAERLSAFEKMAAATANTLTLKAIAEAAADQAEAVADLDAYAAAGKLAAVARDLFAKSGQPAAAKEAEAKAAALAKRQEAFVPVQAAVAKLAADPNDPVANLIVGRFRCFAQGKWDDGVVHLARCGDPALKKLGEMEAKAATDADATDLQRGDAWRDYAATLPEADRPPAAGRAKHWWAKAVLSARGVDRATAENRLAFTANNVEFRPGLVAELSALGKKRWGRVEPTIDVKAADFRSEGPAVQVKWTGRLVAPVAGRYKLIAETPDAVKVTIGDDRPAIDGRGRTEAVVTLPDTPRTITVTWAAPTAAVPRGKGDPHGLTLKWVRPGTRTAEVIPPGALYWASSDKAKLTEK